MGGARKVAREVGATPVLAADSFSNQDRQLAARLGVVLLDSATLASEGGPTAAGSPAAPGLGADTGRAWPGLAPIPARRAKESEPEPHPWPPSGRVGGRDGPSTRAVDVDDLLAGPTGQAGASGAPAGDPLVPDADEAEESARRSDPRAADSDSDAAPEGGGLWKRPRERAAAPAARPRTPASGRFAWLGGDVSPGPSAPALAVEYDDAVPARGNGDGGDGGDGGEDREGGEDRLGETVELLPTLDEARRQAARDRLMRRLFWILFAAVVLYLVALWWF
jgi:hypothetical protein